MTHLGTFTGINYRRAKRANFAASLLAGIAIAAFAIGVAGYVGVFG